MNKYKQLLKKVTKQAFLTLIIVGGAGAVFGGISYYESSVEQVKQEKQRKLTEDENTLSGLRSQMDKSGEAEKSFAAIRENHNSNEFSAGMDALTVWLRTAAQTKYRFQGLKLTPVSESPTEKPDLKNYTANYNIYVRPRMKLEFKAASDLHIFSFLQDLSRSLPGLVRIDLLDIKRIGDIDETRLSDMRNGVTPLLVDATVEFTWIRVSAKDKKPMAADGQPTPPPGN